MNEKSMKGDDIDAAVGTRTVSRPGVEDTAETRTVVVEEEPWERR